MGMGVADLTNPPTILIQMEKMIGMLIPLNEQTLTCQRAHQATLLLQQILRVDQTTKQQQPAAIKTERDIMDNISTKLTTIT